MTGIRLVVVKMDIPKISFPIYGIIIVISIVIGFLYIYFSLKKEKVNNKNIFLYFLMLISFSVIFGKLFTVITNPEESNLLTAGISSYGGLVGLILSSYIFEKIVPMNNKLLCLSVISLPLIYGIGKIACFIAGCCYGIPYNGIFAVVYTDDLNIPLFPVQLLETVLFIIIFIVCNRFKDNKNIIYITLMLCIIFKFLLDFLRYDHLTKFITVNQIFSIILFVMLIVFIFIREIILSKKLSLSKNLILRRKS